MDVGWGGGGGVENMHVHLYRISSSTQTSNSAGGPSTVYICTCMLLTKWMIHVIYAEYKVEGQSMYTCTVYHLHVPYCYSSSYYHHLQTINNESMIEEHLFKLCFLLVKFIFQLHIFYSLYLHVLS